MVILIFFFLLALVVFLFFYIKPSRQSESFTDLSANTVAQIPEFKPFYDWHQQFCGVWDKVIDNAMKVDQTSETKDNYIAMLETQENAVFPRCDPILTANPAQPQAIVPLIPSTPDTYDAAILYMGKEISKIKQQTEAALQGQSPASSEAFEDVPPPSAHCSPTCIPETPEEKETRQDALLKIRQALIAFNPSIPKLQGKLAIIQSGLNDLNAYKERAQSGEIVKDIKIS